MTVGEDDQLDLFLKGDGSTDSLVTWMKSDYLSTLAGTSLSLNQSLNDLHSRSRERTSSDTLINALEVSNLNKKVLKLNWLLKESKIELAAKEKELVAKIAAKDAQIQAERDAKDAQIQAERDANDAIIEAKDKILEERLLYIQRLEGVDPLSESPAKHQRLESHSTESSKK